MSLNEHQLADWRDKAMRFEDSVAHAVVGQSRVIHLITLALFARGHIMLEGDVGVGKTTLLRAVARGLGGAFERVEGTVDLLPGDLLYHTYIDELGKPNIAPGPLLKQGEDLAVFFFNEINRARPQVHALLLGVMAERRVNAFNREFRLPHLQVFADRNRVEQEETFEIPSAARDRFMLELSVEIPADAETQRALLFDTRFHDVDGLVESVEPGVLDYREMTCVCRQIQAFVEASPALGDYARRLWHATRDPQAVGVRIDGVDMPHLIKAGSSPRGMSLMLQAARVQAWLAGRNYLLPEDVHLVFAAAIAHRIFLNPVYELRRDALILPLMQGILGQVATP
ncbi:MAG: AAA family ATPase [Methylococcaceae bacterium]